MRHRLNRLLALLAICLTSSTAIAQPADDWITVRAGSAFSFEAPNDLKTVPVQGIDSFVGQYQSSGFSLQFDYGLYSNSLDEMRTDPRYETEAVVIDGRAAEIFTGPADGCELATALYMVVDRGRGIRLEMDGCANGYAGVLQMHRLFKSITFSAPKP